MILMRLYQESFNKQEACYTALLDERLTKPGWMDSKTYCTRKTHRNRSRSLVQRLDQFRLLGNYPPTPSLSQHFAPSEK